jgi:hypothetical protein
MAKIQIYESQVAQQPVDAGQVEPSFFTGGGAMMREQAQALEEINQKFKQIRDLKEITKNSTDMDIEFDKLNERMSTDPNADIDVYRKEAVDIRNKYATQITDEASRIKFSGYADKSLSDTTIKMNALHRENEVQAQQYETLRRLDELRLKHIGGDKTARDEALQLLQNNVSAGIMNAAVATKARVGIEEDWQKATVMAHAEVDAKKAMELLDSGEIEISDPILKEDIRGDLLNKIERQEKIKKLDQVINKHDVIQNVAELHNQGALTEEHLRFLVATGRMETTEAENWKDIINEVPNAESKAAIFSDLYVQKKNLFNRLPGIQEDDLERTMVFYQSVLDAKKNKTITQAEMATLLSDKDKDMRNALIALKGQDVKLGGLFGVGGQEINLQRSYDSVMSWSKKNRLPLQSSVGLFMDIRAEVVKNNYSKPEEIKKAERTVIRNFYAQNYHPSLISEEKDAVFTNEEGISFRITERDEYGIAIGLQEIK